MFRYALMPNLAFMAFIPSRRMILLNRSEFHSRCHGPTRVYGLSLSGLSLFGLFSGLSLFRLFSGLSLFGLSLLSLSGLSLFGLSLLSLFGLLSFLGLLAGPPYKNALDRTSASIDIWTLSQNGNTIHNQYINNSPISRGKK